MKTTVSREQTLPSFKLGIADLKLIVEKASELFDSENLRITIDIQVGKKEYSFDNIDEIQEIKELPNQTLLFYLRLSDLKKRLSMFPGRALGNSARITTESENEAWCAGAIATLVPLFQQSKTWYSGFRGWPIGAGLLLSLNLPTSLPLISRLTGKTFNNSVIYSVVPIVVFTLLYFTRYWLLPTNLLVIRQTETTFKKYSTELTVTIALLSLIVSIIGLFIKK